MEQEGLRRRRPGPACRLQGGARWQPAARLPDRRSQRNRQDDHDLYPAEQLQAGPGRLRRADAGGTDLRHGERLLRQDLRPGSETRAHHLWRGDQAGRIPGKCLAERGRRAGGLFRYELHAERPRDVRAGGAGLGRRCAQHRAGRRAADSQPQRQHHSGGCQARLGARRRLLHARRDPGHLGWWQGRDGEGAASPRDQSVLPAPTRTAGQSVPRVAPLTPLRGLPHEHWQRRRG